MTKRSLFLLALPTIFLWHCSDADTLADEPPVEVVIQGPPSWENGIGELVRLKCGYCHAVPRPAIAPDNIPDDLDLNVYDTTVADDEVVRGADALGRWLFDGILNQPVTRYTGAGTPRRMPLDYATQLTEREMANLELWSDNGSPRVAGASEPDGDPNSGGQLYFGGGCQVCHALGTGVTLNDGSYLGPEIRPEAATTAKIKSMWLHKVSEQPLNDTQAADIRAYILQILGGTN